jgi:hypothetical protein
MTDTTLIPEPTGAIEMLHDDAQRLDPLADVEEGMVKNRAKVGSARPSSLLYTYGPGAVMDLPGVLDHAGGPRRLGTDLEATGEHPGHPRTSTAQSRPAAPRPPGRRAPPVPVAAPSRDRT